MGLLQNRRQETFCQLVAAGRSATAAYATAYGRARDPSSRVNGQRLLMKANICERIAEIRQGAALASLPILRKVLAEAGRSAVDRIQTGSFRGACSATEEFAKMVLRLSR